MSCQRKKAEKNGQKDWGAFKEFACLTKDADASGTPVMQTPVIANPKTNTHYLFIFVRGSRPGVVEPERYDVAPGSGAEDQFVPAELALVHPGDHLFAGSA